MSFEDLWIIRDGNRVVVGTHDYTSALRILESLKVSGKTVTMERHV